MTNFIKVCTEAHANQTRGCDPIKKGIDGDTRWIRYNNRCVGKVFKGMLDGINLGKE